MYLEAKSCVTSNYLLTVSLCTSNHYLYGPAATIPVRVTSQINCKEAPGGRDGESSDGRLMRHLPEIHLLALPPVAIGPTGNHLTRTP
jgi:hypothetical protein